MTNFTIRQLRYFEALARHGHFGHAAAASAVSQPALSVQIKELEESLGTALFERGARGVRLTLFGEEFAQRVREILARIDDLGALAQAARGEMVGRMRLGVIPTVAPYLLPNLLGKLNAAYGNLSIHLRESMTEKLVRELIDGQLDAAIIALPAPEPSLTERLLFTEPFLLVRRDDERDRPPPPPEELAQSELLLLEEGHCFREQALAYCGLSGVQPKGFEGSSLATLVQMVGAGAGVTLIPAMAERVETRSAPVVTCAMPEPQPERTIGMVWRKTNPQSDQLEEFADKVQALTKHRP